MNWLGVAWAVISGLFKPQSVTPPETRQSRFPNCLPFVLRWEGGFVDNPSDSGGATNMGITLATLSDFVGRQVTLSEVQSLTKDDASKIYEVKYWNAAHCDALPDGVDLCVFDAAVMSGVSQGAKFLQAAVGIAQDGVIGSETLVAVGKEHLGPIIQGITDQRIAFYKALNKPEFLAGWLNRVNACKTEALAMIAVPANA